MRYWKSMSLNEKTSAGFKTIAVKNLVKEGG